MVVAIGGRRLWLWRAVDSEGEILDLLVQPKRDKTAAVRLMRKLLKKHGYAPRALVTDKLRSYGAAKAELGVSARPEQGLRKNNRPKTRIRWCDGESGRCSSSSRSDQRSASCRFIRPSTTPSISSAISSPAARSACSGPKPWSIGSTQRRQVENRACAGPSPASFQFP